jgi:hypothetical protein
MKTKLIYLAGVVLLGAVCASSAAAKTRHAVKPPNNIVLVYNGPAIANSHSAPTTSAFSAWCDSTCSPSVNLPVDNAMTGQQEGSIYVWTNDFVVSSTGLSECFGEFIWFALKAGAIYADSGTDGTCGAAIDPSLKPPTHIDGPGTVLAGGGDGTIVGGTRWYWNSTGTYTDRTFVEEPSAAGGTNYYDQLFFSISRN